MSNRFRILQVSHAAYSGGAERIAYTLFDMYRQMGHTSSLAVGWKADNDPDIYQIPSIKNKWEWFWDAVAWRVPKSLPGSRGVKAALDCVSHPGKHLDARRGHENFRFPGTWRLEELTPERPNIIHCHNLHSPRGYFDLRALPELSARFPVMITLHDAWLLSGHCAHSLNCERWKIGCGHCPDLTLYPAIQRDATAFNFKRKREILASSRLYIASPCRWLLQKVEHSMLAPAVIESRVVPNGLDLTVFRPADRAAVRTALGLPLDRVIVLFAANGIRKNVWKDYETMRMAIATVAQRLTQQKILFLAVGEDAPPEQIGPAEIRFVPYQSDPAVMAQYYQAADLYLHGARADTFPTTVLEALACGVPVVATDIGGIPEQIRSLPIGPKDLAVENPTGMLVPLGKPEAMATAMVRILSDGSLRSQLSDNAQRDARERFDIKRQAEAYLDWYRTILRGNQKALQPMAAAKAAVPAPSPN